MDQSQQNHEGQDRVKPCEYFISFACSQPAGNCRFKSTPLIFAFQPEGNGISGNPISNI
jgi:hypothetical protein